MKRTLLPLHPAQLDVYTDQLINNKSPHYNIGGYIKLKGELNKEKFNEAIHSAPDAFDAFKLRFNHGEASPVCYIDHQYVKQPLPELDFSSHQNPEETARQWMQDRFNTPLLITEDTIPFEEFLVKIAANEYWFFGKYHHLVTDGYGFIVFVKYIAQKYKSLVENQELTISYASYGEEINNAIAYTKTAAYEADGLYWKNKIGSLPEKIIPAKYQLREAGSKTSSTYILEINSRQQKILHDIQTLTNAGPQQLTIAALLIFFGKTSGHSEFVFGIPVHKRGSRKLRNIVGMFSGMLPFKGYFAENKTLAQLLAEISISQKADYRHQHFQIGDLTRSLKATASDGYLYQVSINYEPLDFELDFGAHVKSDVVRISNDYEKNPLQLSWLEYGASQTLKLQVHFGNAFFTQPEIELLTRRILYIIEQFPAALNKTLGDIDILPPQEKELLDSFNATSETYPESPSIISSFEAQVEKTPGNIALVYKEQQLTYLQLNELANQLGHHLISCGIKKDTLVPLCVKRSAEMIVGILGILKAGGAYVPIDPEYPEERIRFILEDTGAGLIVSGQECVTKLGCTEATHCILLDNDWPLISKQNIENVHAAISKNDLAYIIYTSGSTGKPKGVMVEHNGVLNLVNAQSSFFNITSDERILQFSNYCFDASVEQIFLALFNGASLILFPEGFQLNIPVFETFLKNEKVSHIHATPAFIENLGLISYDGLKRIIAGGDTCKKELAAKWKNKTNFYNEYGPTETTVTSVVYQDHSEDKQATLSLPVGKPIANTQLYILDKNRCLLPVGVAGDLYIAGEGVARGYLNRPELTTEKFISNPFSSEPACKMYQTGDLARWLPDGNVEYLGRIDEQVKIRGYRIELGEIENVLQEFEGVKQSVVLAKEDKEGQKRLVGFVVPTGIFDKEAIQTYLRKKLPAYMVPAVWIQLDSIPLTSNGKIDRKSLPNPDADDTRNEYEAPADEMEYQLCVLWEELLKADRIGVNDNFFELGGHSLNAIQLTSRIHKLLNIKTDIGTVFSNPTIRQLGHALLLEKKNQFSEITPLPVQEHYPLSHAQKRFWVLSHFANGSAAYNVSNAFIIEGELNIDAFRQAFDTVIDRHEILRTVFTESEGEVFQKILPLKSTRFTIEEIDLQNKTNPDAFIKNWMEADSRQAFDLIEGPLLRTTIFREARDKFILVFNIHHIISDGWSKGIFIREILHVYKALSNGAPNNLTPLLIQYKDYADWHNASCEMQGKYWRSLYATGIPVLDFPVDFNRPKVLTFFGEMLHIRLAESLTQGLQKIAVHHNMSLNNLLFALYALQVARYSGQEEVVIGTLSSGRSHVDLENLIGVFINFLPVKLSVKKPLKLSDYLDNSQHTLIQAYNNQDYPFDMMVDDCIKHRDISRNPFFDTMVNFHLENDLKEKIEQQNKELMDSGISLKPYEDAQDNLYQSVLDFKLDIEPAASTLDFYLSYNSKLFLKETMHSFLQQFVELLDTIVNEPAKYLQEYGNWREQLPAHNSRAVSKQPDTTPGTPLHICASFVMEPVQEFVEYWSSEFDLNIQLSFAPYNQVFQQLINPQSLLNKGTGINAIFLRLDDWLRDKQNIPVPEQLDFLQQTFAELTAALGNINKTSFAPILFGIIPLYNNSKLSSIVASRINQLNSELAIFIKTQSRFHLLDLDKIIGLYEVDDLYDAKADELGHMPLTREYYAAIGTHLARKVNAFKGSAYKVIALDCDNTLWKGVCGELGALEVTIDEDFQQLQEFMLQKYQEGFLLVLCSKNNEADVWEVFDRHPGMKLKREHIAAHRINWQPKPGNLISIAAELNLGVSSFIFVDDSEFEIEQMCIACPEVYSIPLPEQTTGIKNFLDHIWAFDYFQVTEEDRKRNQMYLVEKQRKEESQKYSSLEDFLESLEIRIKINPLTDMEIERAVQLTIRTNQFNLNGIKKTASELAGFIHRENTLNWVIDVKDRFGDYGIAGIVLAKQVNQTLVIESFLLSCRVLGRNVEGLILAELLKYAENHELTNITALYQPTSKNKPFREFLSNTEWIPNPVTNIYTRLLTKKTVPFEYETQTI